MDEEAGKQSVSPPTTTLKSACIDAFKTTLKLWQIVSVAAILVLDIMHFVNHIKQHRDHSGWIHYNCYVEIILSSSNFKTFWANFMTMISALDYKSHLGLLFWIFGALLVIEGMLIFPTFCTHLIPAFATYCWVWIVCIIPYRLLLFCLLRWREKQEHKRLSSALYCCLGLDVDSLEKSKEKEGDDRFLEDEAAFQKSPLVLIILVLCFLMIPGLSQCYWYSGHWSYIESFVEVFTERPIKQYLSNVTNEYTSMFRFLTTVL